MCRREGFISFPPPGAAARAAEPVLEKGPLPMLQRLGAFLQSSIGRKFAMAITGAALALFVLIHLLGNLTLFADAEGLAFNAYAHML